MVPFDRQETGKLAESRACEFLQEKGFKLLELNYRCPFGEVDLIMRDREEIVFVEVRSRKRIDYGNALESINKRKMHKLIKTATHFLQRKNWLHKVHSRFDVVALHPVTGKIQLEWIKNAFSAES